MCSDRAFVLLPLACGVLPGSRHKFVEARGSEHPAAEVKLDRAAGIRRCPAEVSGKPGGYRDKLAGKGGTPADGTRILGDGVKRFGVKPITPAAGGSDRYATGSVPGSAGLDSGLQLSYGTLCPGPMAVAI